MRNRLRHGRTRETRARGSKSHYGSSSPFPVQSITPLPDIASGRVARDPRFERLPCSHTGTYADDCLVQRVTAHRCYIVATCDKELRRRIRKVPGVPLMYIVKRKYAVERLPDSGQPV